MATVSQLLTLLTRHIGKGNGIGVKALAQQLDTTERHVRTLVEELRSPIAFYFDVGKYEPQFIPAHHRLVPLLEAKGCPCFFQELTGGHNWTSWPR